jgi:hypothetical protein
VTYNNYGYDEVQGTKIKKLTEHKERNANKFIGHIPVLPANTSRIQKTTNRQLVKTIEYSQIKECHRKEC